VRTYEHTDNSAKLNCTASAGKMVSPLTTNQHRGRDGVGGREFQRSRDDLRDGGALRRRRGDRECEQVVEERVLRWKARPVRRSL
jgi:hypothetical protein